MLKSATFAAALLAATAAHAQEPGRDSVVATVDGVEITLGQMIVVRSQLPAQYQQLPPEVLFTGILDQLIQQQLLAAEIAEAPASVEIAVANERRALMAGVAIDDLTRAAVTDEAVQAAYDARIAGMEAQTEFNASHILVATEEEAKAAIARIEGGAAFADVAKELSTDPGSGAQGGTLGWFGQGMMVPEFEAGVAALEPGQMSAPVQSQFGWHIILLNETRDKPLPTLDELRNEIGGQLQDEAVTKKLDELTSAATITRPEEGAFDPAILTNLDLLSE